MEKSVFDNVTTSSPPDTNLYHYTSQLGLLGITQSNALWATKIQYFNDGQELELGLDIAQRKLRRMLKEAAGEDETRLVHLLVESLDQVRTVGKYVFSFSREGDSLSQWRAYCRVGDGFCLGLVKSELEAVVKKRGWRIVECTYDTEEHHRRVHRLLAETLSGAKRDPANNGAHAWRFAQRFADVALELKNPTFSDEKEIRLISPAVSENDERIDYREGAFSLCPYYSFQLTDDPAELPLERVTVGPTPYPELSIQATAAFLRKRQLNRTWVYRSRTSLRLW